MTRRIALTFLMPLALALTFHVVMPGSARAALSEDPVTIEGKVDSMTADIVMIDTDAGMIALPRKTVDRQIKSVRPGMDVQVHIPLSEVIMLNEGMQEPT